MAPTSQYLSSNDLSSVDHEGLINEDVMNQIWDISRIPLPFTDMVGSDSAKQHYTSWTTDKLADPETGGWMVDGQDSDQNDSNTGKRIGNFTGILGKELQVTERARASDTIGRGDELSYQVMMRQREVRRNVEANALGIQGSQEDDGDATPGIPAGLATMMTAHDSGSGATPGAFSAGTWTGVTPGAGVAISETMVRDACQATWEDGGDPSQLMSVPGVVRQLSAWMFSNSAGIATMTRETKGVGKGGAGQAMGAVNVFITDFGVTLDFVPNRIQRTYGSGLASVFIFDPAYFRLSFLKGYRTVELAKRGLADRRHIAVDWTVKALEPDAGRVLHDIDPAAEAVAAPMPPSEEALAKAKAANVKAFPPKGGFKIKKAA